MAALGEKQNLVACSNWLRRRRPWCVPIRLCDKRALRLKFAKFDDLKDDWVVEGALGW